MRVPDAFQVGAASHTGRIRVNNEDDYLLGAVPPSKGELLLCAVADGMGGAAGGAEASRTALRALGGAVLGAAAREPVEVRLREGFRQAAQRVFDQATAVPALRGMGTTLTALCLRPGRAVVGHVGDTRLYRLRNGAAERLTEDHAVRRPENLLTRCVGGGRSECETDLAAFDTAPGDRFVLLSDGVWGVVAEEALAALAGRDGPQAAAEALVAAALTAGGPDNATAVVADVLTSAPSRDVVVVPLERDEQPGPRAVWPRPRSLRPPLWPWIALLVALALAGVAVLRWWAGIDLLARLLQNR